MTERCRKGSAPSRLLFLFPIMINNRFISQTRPILLSSSHQDPIYGLFDNSGDDGRIDYTDTASSTKAIERKTRSARLAHRHGSSCLHRDVEEVSRLNDLLHHHIR